jgi:hypothetical protein
MTSCNPLRPPPLLVVPPSCGVFGRVVAQIPEAIPAHGGRQWHHAAVRVHLHVDLQRRWRRCVRVYVRACVRAYVRACVRADWLDGWPRQLASASSASLLVPQAHTSTNTHALTHANNPRCIRTDHHRPGVQRYLRLHDGPVDEHGRGRVRHAECVSCFFVCFLFSLFVHLFVHLFVCVCLLTAACVSCLFVSLFVSLFICLFICVCLFLLVCFVCVCLCLRCCCCSCSCCCCCRRRCCYCCCALRESSSKPADVRNDPNFEGIGVYGWTSTNGGGFSPVVPPTAALTVLANSGCVVAVE